MATPVIAILPGSDAIGHSYDVFGLYANAESVRKELFDFGDQEEVEVAGKRWLLCKDFSKVDINLTTVKTLLARMKDKYSEKLAASVNVSEGYAAFSASVEVDYSSGFTSETDSTYSSVHATVEKWKLSLKDDIETLRSKTKLQFRKALATMDPVKFFEAYGTHFLNEVLVGGRANYVSITKTSAFESEEKVSAAATASFGKLSTGTSASSEQDVKTFRENSSSSLYAIGGSALADIQDADQYKGWLASIDKQLVFSGFTVNSLVPLWKLAESQSRQEELKLATEKFVPIYITRLGLTDLEVIMSNSASVNPPYGFTKIGDDLNRRTNTKGKFIYVCYKQAKISIAGNPVDPKSITNIKVIMTDNAGTSGNIPSGYQLIEQDLNAGARGRFIYICYSRSSDKAEEGLPIRSIYVISSRDGKAEPPYGFTKIVADLNAGAGGDYIYLCYSRHLDGV